MPKVLVVGSGPAGISAAIYARRGGMDVTVLGKGTGALGKAERIENYYGFSEPIAGRELERRGIEGAVRLGIEVLEDEVMELGFTDDLQSFQAKTKEHAYTADALVLATGAARKSIEVPGIAELEGHGVSFCAVCDAFFYRGKTVAVIGAGEYARHEAETLLPHVRKLILFTNGETAAEMPEGMEVCQGKVKAVLGASEVRAIQLDSGEEIAVNGVFLATGTAGTTELSRKLGIALEGMHVKIGSDGRTNIPGVFAAGDCTGGLMQIAKAVHEGAVAGLSAIQYLRGKNAGY